MQEFYRFATENPILCIILFCIVSGAIVRLIPWSKRHPDTIDDDKD